MAELPGLDLCWVHDKLALGGSFPARAIAHLPQCAISHVIDARDDAQDDVSLLLAHGIDFLHVPTPDHTTLDPRTLQLAVSWAFARICQGGGVLIHCEHGIGRSVVLGFAVLVSLGVSPLEAMRRIKTNRPCICPSPTQLESLVHWCAQQRVRTPSWDELARIAYSAPLVRARAERPVERTSGLF